MDIIKSKFFSQERDLYAVKNLQLIDCIFDGVEDGESALKEAKDISLINCKMNLRYPLWHDTRVNLDKVTMTEKCRAALWYTQDIKIKNSRLLGIKALRECCDIVISNSEIVSPEFGWKSHRVFVKNTSIISEYLFLLSKNIELEKVDFKGKYSFQYVENMVIENSNLDTKDAFWHSKNVTIKNSVLKGEYLAWYSESLTLISCKIIGSQPFCYCDNLKLIDCEMVNTDLAFEYSDVDATINSDVISIKNPRSGKIMVNKVDEIIITGDSVLFVIAT